MLNTASILKALGFIVEIIPVDDEARLDLDALSNSLGEDVLLVSCMHANNELGTINPVRQIADLVHGSGALLHTDAVQTFMAPGLKWQVRDLDADLVTASAHKIYGPKGAGAIYIRAGIKLKPLLTGGGQEREMRGGTENVAAISGFGAAVKDARTPTPSGPSPRDTFLNEAVRLGAVPTLKSLEKVLSGHAHLRFPGIDAETVLIVLDRLGVSASSGAACSSGSIEPSHVLQAAGYTSEECKEGLRFSFGRDSTLSVALEAANRLKDAIQQIRSVPVKK